MNDRYGVDPCAANSVAELANLLIRFGPEYGRFIYDFPPDWITQVRGQFQESGDVNLARLTEWLRRAKSSLLPTKARYSANQAWAQNAALLIKDVRGLIGPAGSKPPCRALGDILIDPAALPDCRGGHIPRTPQAYADVAKPLMQISRKVVLIDPYFCLRRVVKNSKNIVTNYRYTKSLKALIQVANAERKVEVFKLMVSRKRAWEEVYDENEALFEADLYAMLEDIGTISIEYDFLDDNHSFDMHPRYLLGNECGLKFDYGFDISIKNGETQHVEWIGPATLEPLLNRFL